MCEVEGHLFFISRDYYGPNARALQVSGNNIPCQSMWDMKRAVKKKLALRAYPRKTTKPGKFTSASHEERTRNEMDGSWKKCWKMRIRKMKTAPCWL